MTPASREHEGGEVADGRDSLAWWRCRALGVGSCVSLVFLVLGAPELAAAVFVGSLLVRASHEKPERD